VASPATTEDATLHPQSLSEPKDSRIPVPELGVCTGFGLGEGTVGKDLFALLVMGFPGAADCCNYIAAYLKDDLHSSP
jgi:hypothetical protein